MTINPYGLGEGAALLRLLDQKLRPLEERIATIERRLALLEREKLEHQRAHYPNAMERFLAILHPRKGTP
jgi:hypothetical protein